MKKFASKVIQLTCLIFIVSAFSNPTSPESTLDSIDLKKDKIALIITINEYEKDSGWSSINANNDAPLVKYALMQQGFEEGDIAIVQNESATKAGIFKAIKDHLIKKAKSGGVAVFHFSGHGQQVQDQNDDELDGYDEAIVPFDSPMYFQKGVYEGENLIRDEELGNLMTKLRKKLGKDGNLLLILDSCHSGTGTRGLMTARGTEVIMAYSSYIKENEAKFSDKNHLNLSNPDEATKMAPMVAFFGSSAHELNYETISSEGKEVGSLSYAFSQAFVKAGGESTYESLFEEIRILMSSLAPRQTPQAEGTLDQQILGGKILGKLTYFKLGEYDWVEDSLLQLSSGLLSNLFPGTKVGIYPKGTRDFKNTAPLAKGIVKKADLLSSTIELNNVLSEQVLFESRIFVTEQHYGNLDVKLKIDLEEGDLKTALLQKLVEFPIIKTVENGQDLLIEKTFSPADSNQVQMITSDELQLDTSKYRASPNRIAHQLVKSILSYVQCKFLRTLELDVEEFDLRLKFLSLTKDTGTLKNQADTTEVVKRLKVGEQFKLQIQNHGSRGAYYTVLDIQPDNKINILIPHRDSERTLNELYLPKDGVHVFDVSFKVSPPLGTEIIKLIATREPLDLSAIESSRGRTNVGEGHPFEKLFAASYFSEDRGAARFSLSPEIGIHSRVLVIEE